MGRSGKKGRKTALATSPSRKAASKAASKAARSGGRAAAPRAVGRPPFASSGRSGFRFDPTLWGLWLLIWLPPFVVGPGGDSFRLPKLAASEILAILSIALLALRLWRSGAVDLSSLKRSPALFAVLPLVVVASLGVWFGEHRELVATRLPSLWIGAAALVAWSLALTHGERRRLLAGLCVPASLLAFIGIAQFHGFRLFAFTESLTDRLTVTSLAGGAFDLAAYLTLPILLAQWTIPQRSGWRRGAWIACLAICLYGVFATQTLSALGAVLLGSAVLWLPRLGRRRALAWGGGVLAILAVAVLVVTPLRERVVSKASDVANADWNRLLTGRLDGWRAAGWMLTEHPMTGVGHGAYRAEFGKARLALREDGVRFFAGQSNPFFTNAHNEVLEVGAELGAPGLAALAFALWQVGRALRRRRRAGDDHQAVARWSDLESAAWAAIAFHAVFDFPFHLALLAYPWLLLASDTLEPVDPSVVRNSADLEDAVAEGRTEPAEDEATLAQEAPA